MWGEMPPQKNTLKGEYQCTIMYLCHPWSMQQKMNENHLMFGRVWPYLAWTIWNSTDKLVSSNPWYNHQAGSMYPSNHLTLKCSWHFNKKLDDCHVIQNDDFSFIILSNLCENFGFESTQYLPVSQSFCFWASFLYYSLCANGIFPVLK